MSEQFYTAVVFPLMLLVGQTLVALGQRKIGQRMDEGEIIDRKCYKHPGQTEAVVPEQEAE